MAKINAVDEQCSPRIFVISATSVIVAPAPPNSRGMSADIKPSLRIASMASLGNRASASTSSANGPAAVVAARLARSNKSDATTPVTPASRSLVFGLATDMRVVQKRLERRTNRGYRFERLAPERRLRKLDVEGLFQCQHHVDVRVRRHAGLEEV